MNERRQWTFTDTLNQGFILRGYEEDDDIVIMVIHESDKNNIVRFDQSPHKHDVYHSHINEQVYEEFSEAISKEQKINISINKMKEYISTGLVAHKGVLYTAADNISDILEKYRQNMLAKTIEKGTIQGSAAIRATAAIITAESGSSKVQIKQ
jgi:hypothetical protein